MGKEEKKKPCFFYIYYLRTQHTGNLTLGSAVRGVEDKEKHTPACRRGCRPRVRRQPSWRDARSKSACCRVVSRDGDSDIVTTHQARTWRGEEENGEKRTFRRRRRPPLPTAAQPLLLPALDPEGGLASTTTTMPTTTRRRRSFHQRARRLTLVDRHGRDRVPSRMKETTKRKSRKTTTGS